jgi:uncharacterized protein YndB with AHSA1/START domain
MTVASGNTERRHSPEKLELELVRVIDAPRQLVWDAYTRPEHIVKWWGPREYTTTVLEMDVRPGGEWRYLQRAPDGTEHPFKGVYREVVSPERLVSTFIYDVEGIRDQEMIDTAIFEDYGGKTRLTTRAVFPSVESMQGALASGMEEGWTESLDRLEELVTRR